MLLSRCILFLFFVVVFLPPAAAADPAQDRLITLHDNPVPLPKPDSVLEGASDDEPRRLTDVRLYELIDLILGYSPIPQNPFVIYLEEDEPPEEGEPAEPEIPNATAYLRVKTLNAPAANNGVVSNIELERIIVFNRAYLSQLLVAEDRADRKQRWGLVALAAHEVGHFLARHHDTPIHSKDEERQADWISGYFLGRMGASRDEALGWLETAEENGTAKYPRRAERLAAMESGWTAGGRTPKPVKIGDIFSSKARTLDETFTLSHGYDLRGGDLCQVHGAMAMVSCAGQCTRRDDCKAFSYDRWHGRCFLKGEVSGLRYREGKSSIGVLKGLPLPEEAADPIKFVTFANSMLLFERAARSGDPFQLGKAKSVAKPEECQALCKADKRCNGFSAVKPGDPAAEGIAPDRFLCLGFREPALPELSETKEDFAAYKIQEATEKGAMPPECQRD